MIKFKEDEDIKTEPILVIEEDKKVLPKEKAGDELARKTADFEYEKVMYRFVPDKGHDFTSCDICALATECAHNRADIPNCSPRIGTGNKLKFHSFRRVES